MFPIFFIISLLSSFIVTHSYSQCLDHQKSLLLQLKNELIFNSSISRKLVQWNNQRDECCKWYGVECNGDGYVISLQLNRESISGGIGDSSSLFRLKYLENLNLAYNEFNSTLIPKGIHHLTYLTHLNLSRAGFGGQIPLEISFLRRLVSLDISNNYDFWLNEPLKPLKLEYPNLEMLLQNLTGLRQLNLDGVDITSFQENKKWSHIISSYLPNITTLSLALCDLTGPLAMSFLQLHSLSVLRLDYNDLSTINPNVFTTFSSLTTLSLVGCKLKGSFPNVIFQIPTLQHLDLSSNDMLSGSIPPFPQSGSLQSIRLSNTNFSGLIPSSISNLKTLSYIDLSYSKFAGSIPSTFANLTQLTYVNLNYNLFTGSLSHILFESLSNLSYLELGYNSFTGSIPQTLFCLPSLHKLNLGHNKFIGPVEKFSIVNVSYIVRLDLGSNLLEGSIPDSFFQLHSLETMYLSKNMFNGSFQLDKIRGLANLAVLDLSGNNLSIDVGNDDSTSFGLPKLECLILTSCNLYNFPNFIKHSHMITRLDLSDNRIAGEIPSWIWGNRLGYLNLSHNLLTDLQKPYHIPNSLYFLDLHSNQFRGDMHLLINITSDLEFLSLADNGLSGSIPTSLCSATSLSALDLSVNKLSGTIPSCLLDDTMSLLSVLNLRQNNIGGLIPDNFSTLCSLEYLDLNNNSLEGKIPKSIQSCKELKSMNVGNNIIKDTFPCMLSSTLRVLVLHSNRFHGEVRCENNWPDLQIVDISSNNFGGSLESTNFSSWRAMVLGSHSQSRNYMFSMISGRDYQIPKLGVEIIMKGLEEELFKINPDFTTIDFSCNNFRGEIPNAISDLISLRLLNLSNNALNGSIPKSFGKLGELESLDLSQNKLTGHIPMELSRLTFLSVLNVSYNELIGEIPKGRQLQTFSADSFLGNPRLCGFNLNISCSTSHTDDDESDEKEEEKKLEIEWEYVSAALGYAVGLGSFVWLLLFCRSFRHKCFGKIDEFVEEVFNARDRQQRKRTHARRREVRN